MAIPEADPSVPEKYSADWNPDVELENSDERWGLRAVLAPGHTPGNMAFVDESRGYLFAGDTVVHSGSELAAAGDWSGALAPVVPRYNKASMEDARQNITRLARFEVSTVLVTRGGT